MDLGFDIGSGIAGLANTAYNLYTNKRDFDYQKALQQQIFEREDTAVQRRMADLQAAGLNPNLAAGSAAGAGAVVSRSTTNDVNMGSALDMITAANQIKMQRQEIENKNIEQSILNNQYADSTLKLISNLGWDTDIFPTYDGNSIRWNFSYSGKPKNSQDLPIYKLTQSNLLNAERSNEYLQRELNWFTADKVLNHAYSALSLGIPKFSYKIK